MNKLNKSIIKFSLLYLTFFGLGCKKYLDIQSPSTSLSAINVYTDDNTAAATITAIYAQMSNLNSDLGSNGLSSVTTYTGLSGDELTLFNSNDVRFSPFYLNSLTPTTTYGQFWLTIYPIIYYCNSAIEGISGTTTLTPSVKQQLLGEAKFIRALCYFYLVNLYGDVPLVTVSNYKTNELLPRSPKVDIYNEIVSDLKDAQALLSDNYLKADAKTAYSVSSAQRVRPTKWAAAALLARTYLYMGDYANAEMQSTLVINNNSLFTLNALQDVFKMNSLETIWALQPVGTAAKSNTGEGILFVLPSTGPSSTYPVYLSNSVVNSFDSVDQRKKNWVGSVKVGNLIYNYPYKYKIGSINTSTQEYSIVLRLAEQYLIRSEARAQQSNLTGAIGDIDKIRQRAGLPLIAITNPTISKAKLLDTVFHERQIELFTEWGHRWFDLKRTGKIDSVMTIIAPFKGATWSSYKALYPIPFNEIKVDPNIIQNPGY